MTDPDTLMDLLVLVGIIVVLGCWCGGPQGTVAQQGERRQRLLRRQISRGECRCRSLTQG